MDGYDILWGGVGIAVGSGVLSHYVIKTQRVQDRAKNRMAKWSTLEKLLDVYGPKMEPEEFKSYASQILNVVNQPNNLDDKQ